jgi:dihydrodipicolinate synthase/N-acetylneuraminate lyase
LTGSDRLFSTALENHAAGCITALANVRSPDLRAVWDAHQRGDSAAQASAQARLDTARAILEKHQPFGPSLKAVVYHKHHLRRWAVRPPLLPLEVEEEKQLMREIAAAGEDFAN